MYFNGYGVTKDYQKAIEWHHKAAEQGNADHQYQLGSIYDMGEGIFRKNRDHQKAMTWFRKAADQGHAKAQSHL